MTREELLSALDVAPDASMATLDPADLDDGEQARPAGPPPSPTALKLDDWSIRRGQEAAYGEVLGPVLGFKPDDATAKYRTGAAEAELVAADMLAACFEPDPQLAESCTDETRHRFLDALMHTDEYQALHADTRLDAMASELAAGHFAQQYVALAEEDRKEREASPEKSPGDKEADSLKGEIKALGAAGKALEAAGKDVDDLRDAQRGLGGDGAVDGGAVDLKTLRDRFQRIKRSGTLKKIMALAGRYRRLAQAKQRQKTLHGRDDVVGVELGADLGRLCPSELAALADEDLEWDALRRLHERSMMQREYRGVESKAQGPIVVIVDESGSMSGNPIETAKAFALAMGWVARHQRRWIAFVGFSGGCPCNCLAMPPGKWDQGALLDWLEHFYSGGTDRDVPLKELPDVWDSLGCPEGKTDVIQITDAICHVPAGVRDKFLAWKEQTKARYYSLLVGGHGPDDGGPLAEVSDRFWVVKNLETKTEAIGDLLSL